MVLTEPTLSWGLLLAGLFFPVYCGCCVGLPRGTTFLLSSELPLEGLAVGDKITFRLQVDWQATPPATVIRIDKLPPDTVLEWEAGTDDS